MSNVTPSSVAKVYAIPNAHIDPVWIWGWQEGMREVVATFQAAAERLEENPDLYFAASSAAYYAWVDELDPGLFERIRGHVASGRWELVGAEWVEPDCNLPSGESVCRHLLYGQRYFSYAFGQTASVAYNVDSFGHAASLPQLFQKGGLHAYVMMRPQEHEHSLPASLFRWEGVDGTSIFTFRINTGYTTGFFRHDGVDPSVEDERDLLARRSAEHFALAEAEHTPVMMFVGVGDHGGAHPIGDPAAALHVCRVRRRDPVRLTKHLLQSGHGRSDRGLAADCTRRPPYARCRLLLGRVLGQTGELHR